MRFHICGCLSCHHQSVFSCNCSHWSASCPSGMQYQMTHFPHILIQWQYLFPDLRFLYWCHCNHRRTRRLTGHPIRPCFRITRAGRHGKNSLSFTFWHVYHRCWLSFSGRHWIPPQWRLCHFPGMPCRSFLGFPCFFGFPPEPFTNLMDKNPPYFPVWNDKFGQFSSLCTALCQIPGCKKDTPQVIRIGIKIPVSQFLAYCLFDAGSVNQLFDIVSVCCFRFA